MESGKNAGKSGKADAKVDGKAKTEEKAQQAAQAATAATETHLEAAGKTTALMEKAAQEKIEQEVAAKKKREEDDARAQEESERVAEEERAAQQERNRKAQEAEELAQKSRVVVVVKKAFRLNLDNHKIIDYPVGTYPMPKAHYEHWYSQANGVELASDKLDATVAEKTFKSGPVTPKQKALVAAVNAINPEKYADADAAVNFVRSQYGADLTDDLEALIRGKFDKK